MDDVLGVAYVFAKHDNSFQKMTGFSYKNNSAEASLGWSCSDRSLREDNKIF